MNNFNEEVGTKIHKARIEKGITLKDLGDLIGIAESTAQRYEKGKIKSIDIEMIKKLAKALSVSPAYLMGWDDNIKKAMDELNKNMQISVHKQYELQHIMQELNKNDINEEERTKLLDKVTSLLEQQEININKKNLTYYYDKLNDIGQQEAIKRVEELTYIDKYIKVPEHLILKAAHEIDGASEEDKQHDYDLMDDDNF
jgi:transcriptional regulator with XRE-family HTH domain